MRVQHPTPACDRTRALPAAVPPLCRWRRLAAVASLLALAACSHGPPGGPADDDAWVVRGTVIFGPVFGEPSGPYSPR